MATTFAELGVPEPIVDVLRAQGITQPFPVQAGTIPDLLAGRDVVGRAPTGSGKTLAFGIPLVAGVEQAEPRHPRALVLAPTRELAQQIATELTPLAAAMDRTVLAVYGGVGLEPQIKKLRRGVDIVIATPGRLEDLLSQKAVWLDRADRVVLDEADRMADMGFMPAVRRLLDLTPKRRQTALYSATLDGDVGKLVERYQHDPTRHEVGPARPYLKAMEHLFWQVPRPDRIPLCTAVIATFGPTIVFTRTRHGADRAARQLARTGLRTAAIHGNRSQAQRTRALDDFAAGRVHALVATDVAARGIHVDDVACVVHFDPVDEDSAYVHRSGRTARAGAHGTVVSFVDPGQVKLVRAMLRRLELPQEITPPPEIDGAVPDFDDDPDRGDQPRRSRSGASTRARTGPPKNRAGGDANRTRRRGGARTAGSSGGGATSGRAKKGKANAGGAKKGTANAGGAKKSTTKNRRSTASDGGRDARTGPARGAGPAPQRSRAAGRGRTSSETGESREGGRNDTARGRTAAAGARGTGPNGMGNGKGKGKGRRSAPNGTRSGKGTGASRAGTKRAKGSGSGSGSTGRGRAGGSRPSSSRGPGSSRRYGATDRSRRSR